jgi:ribosomal protein L11 methyltransferase
VRSVGLTQLRAGIELVVLPAVEAVLAERELENWSVYQDVLANQAWLIGLFADEAEARRGWSELRPGLPRRGVGSPTLREIADADWRDSYKAHFHAWRCGSLHWIPEWERTTRRIPRGHHAVYLDPGLAFGTGNHETTRLCCRRLVDFARELTPRARRTWRVIDAGCGSGILAISAAKLGCGRVIAFDNDLQAVAVARKNVRHNGVARDVRVFPAGLDELARLEAELVLANIQADVLIAHAPLLLDAVASDGVLVLSGILSHELEHVRRAFAAADPNWRQSSRTAGEWSDLRLMRSRNRRLKK